jgi:hypothetical protein
MTEAEWLACTDPASMLRFLRGKAGERKLRLFVCACTRLLWEEIPVGVMREAVEVAEQYADGRATVEEREKFQIQLWRSLPAVSSGQRGPNWFDQTERALAAWSGATLSCAHWLGLSKLPDNSNFRRLSTATGQQQPHLLRDLFGNPFHPVVLHPSWRTPDAVTLAGHIYHDRAFDRMPELADALEEAGCYHADLLGHLRSEGPHVRGCWVIDALLGKS